MGTEPAVQTQIIVLVLEKVKWFKTIFCDLSFERHVMCSCDHTQDRDDSSIAGIIKTGFMTMFQQRTPETVLHEL
jgi:hypothetical protein